MKAQQSSLFDYYKLKAVKHKYGRTTHGGTGARGHRKEQRPFSSRKWTHLVLKSSRATGKWSFLTPKNKIFIENLISEKAEKFGVAIAEVVNVGNHLHLKLRCSRREGFQNFLKAITCLIARKITCARRGHTVGKFWNGLAFTRVIKTRFEELQLRGYLQANALEAAKGEHAREEFLEKFNRWVYRIRYG